MPPTGTEPQFPGVAQGVLVFRPDRDVKDDDYHGAFLPESERFIELYGIPRANVVQVDVSRAHPDRKAQVLEAICARDQIRALAFFCHGWIAGLQLGFRTETAPVLAAALKGRAAPDLAIALYACSTAGGVGTETAPGGEGGFADRLRDTLVAVGLTGAHVDGHDRIGPTTTNPYVRRFVGSTVLGGDWLVEPSVAVEKAWAALKKELGSSRKITLGQLRQRAGGDLGAGETWARWRVALKNTDLRFRFPFLTREQVLAELAVFPG